VKATLEIPDALYRKVKAKSALLGKPVREVTMELYRRWVHEAGTEAVEERAEEWLESWFRLADEAVSNTSDGPTARDLLLHDRDRLARK